MGRMLKNYFLTFLVLALPFLAISCVDEQVVNDPAQNTNGSILIQSVPSGASIYLFGTNIGKVTPDSVTDIESGNYEISLKLQGYRDTTFVVPVVSKYRTTKSISLRSLKPAGSVIVLSNPSGAQILLNGAGSGKVTPDTLTNLSAGQIFLTLKLQGYKDTTFTVNVLDSISVTKNITMNRIVTPPQQKAGIHISSNPQGAMIFLANSFTGKITPDSLTNLDNGTYSLTLKLKDYVDTTFIVSIANNISVFSNITLTKSIQIPPRKASLGISSVPNGAQIYLNGRNTLKFTPDSLTNLDIGSYSLTLKLAGYNDTTFNVNITDNSRYDRTISLSRIIPRKGSIFINSNPENAQILLNGIFTGKTTPDTLTALDNGNYSITLKESGYYDTTFTIAITNSQNLTRDITLRKIVPKKNSISVQSDPTGASILLNGSNTGKMTPDVITGLSDGSYNITLTLAGYVDTTLTVSVSNGANESVFVKMQDDLPSVSVQVDYQITFLKQLIFTFQFNQDVILDNVEITNPDNGTTTLSYNGTQISKDEKKGILILQTQKGTWSLTFNGKKAGGSQSSFSVTKTIKVKD